MSAAELLGVALAGALGALCRHGLQRAFPAGEGTPWVTVGINLSGGFALGLLTGFALASGRVPPPLRLALSAGFLGAYTTWSTFTVEALALVERGALVQALLYVGAHLLLGFGAAALGLALGRALA